jgi:hypothetical protein
MLVSWEFNRRKNAMADKQERKPRGFGAFNDLMRKLIKVPKEEVDRREAERKAADAKPKK